ncbi:hypothetical protein ACFWY9_33645 [Amycolatopsis sp. NPDC059027]|uniref:hypothetical protein n=1 Tax=unclassified Amycolatopsis TaxID=2618356 RepID=UPI00366B27D5
MTIFATIGAFAGLFLLVLMAVTPTLVDLAQRFPVRRRPAAKPAARHAHTSRGTAHAAA